MIKIILVAQNISPRMSFMAILFFRNNKLNTNSTLYGIQPSHNAFSEALQY
jgi:hypothetical protein